MTFFKINPKKNNTHFITFTLTTFENYWLSYFKCRLLINSMTPKYNILQFRPRNGYTDKIFTWAKHGKCT